MSIALLLALSAFALFAGAIANWFSRIKRVAIPDNRGAFIAAWAGAVALGIGSFFAPGAGLASGILATLAVLGSGGFLTLYSLGKQRAANPISVGDPIPAFAGVDAARQDFASSALEGRPALIKFFRGHW